MRIAIAYRDLYEHALGSRLRASQLDGQGGGHGYRAGLHPSEAQIAALRHLHDVHDQLGRDDVRILQMIVVDDVRWCELGQRLGSHAKTARQGAVGAIKALAVVW